MGNHALIQARELPCGGAARTRTPPGVVCSVYSSAMPLAGELRTKKQDWSEEGNKQLNYHLALQGPHTTEQYSTVGQAGEGKGTTGPTQGSNLARARFVSVPQAALFVH